MSTAWWHARNLRGEKLSPKKQLFPGFQPDTYNLTILRVNIRIYFIACQVLGKTQRWVESSIMRDVTSSLWWLFRTHPAWRHEVLMQALLNQKTTVYHRVRGCGFSYHTIYMQNYCWPQGADARLSLLKLHKLCPIIYKKSPGITQAIHTHTITSFTGHASVSLLQFLMVRGSGFWKHKERITTSEGLLLLGNIYSVYYSH